jgi:RNA polymerase sigma-70 factor (ECF subfamily)
VPPDEAEFQHLIRAWRAGQPGALGELFARYSEQIRAAVRNRLHDKLRAQYDSLDFVQDVWASIVAMPPDRYEFDGPNGLLGFLTRVAQNKVIDVTRQRLHTQRRDVNREERLPQVADECDAALHDRGPTPSQRASGREEWEQVLDRFKPHERAILERLREGYTHEEIAAMAGVCTRTVERIVRRVRERSAS